MIMKFTLLAISGVMVFSGATALARPAAPQTPAPVVSPKQSAQEKKRATERAKLVAQLAQAKTRKDAEAIATQLEALRWRTLTPVTQLLLRRAQRILSSDKPGDAVGILGDAIALQKNEPVLWRLRAQARLVAGDTNNAISDVGAALQMDPDDAQTWDVLSQAEEAHKDALAALKAWQRVLTLNPNVDGGRERLEKLHLKAFGQPT